MLFEAIGLIVIGIIGIIMLNKVYRDDLASLATVSTGSLFFGALILVGLFMILLALQ